MQIIQKLKDKLKDKKNGYILYSFIMFFLFLVSAESVGFDSELYNQASFRTGLLIFFVTLLGSYLTQYSSLSFSKGKYRGLIVSLLPLSLSFGTYLALYHFPNFSPMFRTFSLVVVAGLFYLISLVNNILLVVDEREDVFPLYRVAVTWSQILLVIVSIPVYVGIYKFDQGPIYQNLLAGIVTFIFTGYYLWSLSFDKRIRKTGIFEKVMNCLFCVFLVVVAGFSVSFIPTEAFLRGLFSASVLLFGLNYLDGYVKNKLNKSFLYIYGTIFLTFLMLILVFRP